MNLADQRSDTDCCNLWLNSADMTEFHSYGLLASTPAHRLGWAVNSVICTSQPLAPKFNK